MGHGRGMVKISAEVLHMEVSTIEVRNSWKDQEVYESRYKELSKHLHSHGNVREGDSGQNIRMNADKHRMLKYNTLNLQLVSGQSLFDCPQLLPALATPSARDL